MTDKVSLIGVPSDIGASDRGASMGPEALRVAGLAKMLIKQGCEVRDIGDLNGPENPELPPKDGYRHLDENVAWANKISDAIYSEMNDGHFPIMMGATMRCQLALLPRLQNTVQRKIVPFAFYGLMHMQIIIRMTLHPLEISMVCLWLLLLALGILIYYL